MVGRSGSIVKVVVMVVVAAAMGGGEAMTCGDVNSGLLPCVKYLKSGGVPTPECCNGVRTINDAAKTPGDRRQACNCLKTAAHGVAGIVPANALSLPSKCRVNIPYKISYSTDCNSVR
ncbi:Non-specific lipid-transfer protein [Euphorbia peplus]|nr:Non-specific lipid-transfer protein [Euphorbia peplus]